MRIHLANAQDRMSAISTWAGDVLPLLLDTEFCKGPANGYPKLVKTSFVQFFTPMLKLLVEEWAVRTVPA